MALKVKAVERLLKFDKNDPGSYRYVLKTGLITSRRIIFTPSVEMTGRGTPTSLQWPRFIFCQNGNSITSLSQVVSMSMLI